MKPSESSSSGDQDKIETSHKLAQRIADDERVKEQQAAVRKASLEQAQASNKTRERQRASRLKEGDLVSVVMNSGDTESGWKIIGFDRGNATVQRTYGKSDQVIVKNIPPVELYAINRPDSPRPIIFRKWQELWERAGGLDLPPGQKPPLRLTPEEARAFFASQPTEEDLGPVNRAKKLDVYKNNLRARAFARGTPLASEVEMRQMFGR